MKRQRGEDLKRIVPAKQTEAKMEFRLTRVARVTSFEEERRNRPALRYWLSRPPDERIAAVEFLRRQEPTTR